MKALVAILAIGMSVANSKAEDLGPGSPAPALSIKSWVKGEPVAGLAKDKTYVVEFWATWCGPCVESIPHLTEVAHKNPDVTFIGVSVWEDDKGGSIKEFVDKMGDKMDYHVAYSGNQEGMARTWMEPAAQNGIPAAFIVKGGVIQWIGHPMEVEGPLGAVKAGTFDLPAFRAKFDKQAQVSRRQMALNAEFGSAMKLFDEGKRAEAKTKLAVIAAKNPAAKSEVEDIRFRWLAKEDPKAWEKQANEIAKSKTQRSIQKLRSFALAQATSPNGDAGSARKALELVLRESDRTDPITLQYAMLIYEGVHDYSLAKEYVTKLLSVLPDTPQNAELRKELEKKKIDFSENSKHSR